MVSLPGSEFIPGKLRFPLRPEVERGESNAPRPAET
jgi:hypothetical protein